MLNIHIELQKEQSLCRYNTEKGRNIIEITRKLLKFENQPLIST